MLDLERQFFEEQKARFATEHLGRFVLIKGTELIGTFNTIEEAVTEGARRYGLEPFLVRQIVQTGVEEVNIPALKLGILSANSTPSV